MKIVIFTDRTNGGESNRADYIASRLARHDTRLLTLPEMRFLRKLRLGRFVRKAVSQADAVITDSPELSRRAAEYGTPVLPLPDGVDFDLYHGAAERNLPFPDDLFNVKNPILGHLGAVDGNIDLRYIEAAAKAHPEWAFVFVGPVLTDISPVSGMSNVHMLGEKPPKLLPVYISRFDVCLNTAKKTATSPFKLYEYLATGKPIVSTPHPAQVLDYTEVTYIAGTHDEFIACCKKAIGERDAWKVRRRIEYGRAASWDARAADLERMLLELGAFEERR